ALEPDTELVRIAPYHAADPAGRTVVRQEQHEVVGKFLRILDVDPRTGVGCVGDKAVVQIVGCESDPGHVAHGLASIFALVFAVDHIASAPDPAHIHSLLTTKPGRRTIGPRRLPFAEGKKRASAPRR